MHTSAMFHQPCPIKFLGILILGGSDFDSMEYYFAHNPEQNRLSEQRMITGRKGHVSVLMADGRILTAGGRNGDWNRFSSTELFDPESGRVTRAANMTTARVFPAAALIGQDLYVAGGVNSDSGILSSCGRLHSGKWTSVASMNEERDGLVMVAVNGKLFTFGGWNGSKWLSSVECYDPSRD